MAHTSQSHRSAVCGYLNAKVTAPIRLSDTAVREYGELLAHLVGRIGNLHWLVRLFLHSLDLYWKKVNAVKEDALAQESMIGPYMQQLVLGRQFSRISVDSNRVQIEYNASTINGFDQFWNPYYDKNLPEGIEDFDEPYRTLYLQLKFLSAQMSAMTNSRDAMQFLASLFGGFALSYPTKYLDSDPHFIVNLEHEVKEAPLDEDYTYYLCRMVDYSLFERIR